jgi:hypothetical protein
VKDQTKHYDEGLWFLAIGLWKRAKVRDQDPRYDLATLIHYVLNMEGDDEQAWLKQMWKKRKELDKSDTIRPEVDHGWELKELRKAGLWK